MRNLPSGGGDYPARMDGLRFAFGTLTVFPARITRWDRDAARAGMLCAPVAGLVVGVSAAALGGTFLLLGSGPLLAAVAATAVPAVLTRGLHLDGLADTADGLGSAKPAEDALRIMKQSDIGPFGVITIVLVLLAQVAALTRLYEEGWAHGTVAAALAATVARLALTHASRHGVPAARPEGLGAIVAATVPVRSATLSTALVLVACAAAGLLSSPYDAVRNVLAAGAALGAAALLLRRCIRRFGGVTGDVFGALEETAATVALVALTLG
ncbi:adenosylcobinamide-GDP ribazoletransferase [Streptomyces gardneri]|uniref:adenosylcobinamide-GDP ribazoletransferase n=1 Tax=Streptomyces gardneri TaxID=66892 RepID=UPI0006E19B8E|nr:adenosylcobinamide-GDP ribazoletransferase [Streptomyces gardneri]QPK45106.1 adenosylcobinamide-GDP ribazoletransferase [Streptomyces gardneri]WRK36422.1 adenosylcobinamide-GDP ribazoletransferase [Streptomyces venezuelae]